MGHRDPRDADSSSLRLSTSHAFRDGEPVVIIVDEHDFRFFGSRGSENSCRVQILLGTASGSTVTLVTQVPDDAGGGAMNSAEDFTIALKGAYFADAPEWPPFVWHYIEAIGDAPAPTELGPLHWTDFKVQSDGGRPSAGWPAAPAGVLQLVRKYAKSDRGADFVPYTPAPPTEAPWWACVPVADLPPAYPFRKDCLKTPARWALLGRYRHRRRARRCGCWYHRVDWSAANNLALDALNRVCVTTTVEHHGFTDAAAGHEYHDEVTALARDLLDSTAASLPTRDLVREAARSLLAAPIVVAVDDLPPYPPTNGPNGPLFGNGQHRVQAMRDQKVSYAPVTIWVPAASTRRNLPLIAPGASCPPGREGRLWRRRLSTRTSQGTVGP